MALHSLTHSSTTTPPAPRPLAGPCPLCDVFDLEAAVQLQPAGKEICRQGGPSYRVYRVRSGAVASYRLFADGRRQVMSFHLPGDFVGLEAGLQYASTSVCLSDAVLETMRRSELSDAAATDPGLARALWQVATRAFQRSEEHALILARQGALERVVAFLLDFSDRLGGPDAFDVPMTRQDIADHLGLTIHTVSRTLSQLDQSALIEARSSRQVRLVDRAALEEVLQ